jgi:Raf kinase inhibitor-like YbhB/YbcL family protein
MASTAATLTKTALTLTSSAFRDGDPIPTEYTCDGADRCPELRWDGAPEGTRSFALIVHDPDAPRGDFTHWVLFNIPAGVREIPAGAEPGDIGDAGTNDFGNLGYGGPCPPPGHGRHRYYFLLYALDQEQLSAGRGAKRQEVEATVRGHVLGQTQLMGTYERP